MTRPTVVLFHGAWHGVWSWRDLNPELHARGMSVAAHEQLVATPDGIRYRMDRYQDRLEVGALLDAIPGQKVLVGHSGGGVTMTFAAAGRVDVDHLVYVASFMPGGDVDARMTGWGVEVRSQGIEALREAAPELFYNDCDPETQRWAAALLAPVAPLVSPPEGFDPGIAWKEHPSTYVVSTIDQAVDPKSQREVALASATEMVEIEAGHSPFFSKPADLAEIIVGIVKRYET